MNRTRPDEADLPHRQWRCDDCHTINSWLDADCQFCNKEDSTMDARRIFSVPVRLRVDCTLFILANDLHEARTIATTVDLNDYLTFDTDSLSTDGEKVLKVVDVFPLAVTPEVDHIAPVPTEEYPPNTHPFFVDIPRK